MDGIVGRVVSGRIFKQFASLVRKEILGLRKGHPRPSSCQAFDASGDPGTANSPEHIGTFNEPAQESNSQHPLTEDKTRHSNRPPLTARYLEVVTFQGGDGEVGSALTLTDTLIWQMNKTFRGEFKIAKCRERISAIESRQSELDKKVQDLNNLL